MLKVSFDLPKVKLSFYTFVFSQQFAVDKKKSYSSFLL